MRAIDGDALSDWMKDYGQKCINGERKISLMYVWKHIQDMQTIEERGMGKWANPTYDAFSCNQCGRTFIVIQGGDSMNFCPNCGAMMLRGGDE